MFSWKICDIAFEKVKKVRGGTVNKASVYAEAVVGKVFQKSFYDKFRIIHKKASVPESPFWKSLTLWICNYIKNETLVQVFSCAFCEICKNTFFAEQHRTTDSYYSNINSSEGRIGKQNCKLWYKN